MKELKICQNTSCSIDYPHNHVHSPGGNRNWYPSIDDPAVSASWPDRLKWQRPDRREHFTSIFKFGWFSSHSGFQLPWKLDLERLTTEDWEAIASIIRWKFAFRSVYGVPKGGSQLARALDKYASPDYPVLIVDDVLTTGKSMTDARARLGDPENAIGVVVVARGPCPSWVWPIISVNEWSQSRATGLG